LEFVLLIHREKLSMADSIVSTVLRFLTPEVIGKLASASGLDRSLTPTVVGAAVPSILSALTGLASQPGGARQLANAVAQQPSGILESIASSLTGPAMTGDKGTSLLSSLLGGGPLGLLTSTVSRFLGVGEGPVRTLMGLVTPAIMGVLGREQRAAGLDAGGLARMLMGQKDQITAAMPAGLSQLLETSGLHEDITSRVVPERRQYEPTGTGYNAAARQQARSETNWWSTSWPYWVLPLLALAGLLWYLLPRERETVAVDTPKTTTQPMRDVQTKSVFLSSAPDNWVSVGSAPNEYVNKEIYNRAGQQLGTIKDVLVGPDGKTAALIINVGQYLGIGDKEMAVPFFAVQRDGAQRIVIDVTKDVVQAAPVFVRQKSSKQ
jgi:hypothetical protein